MPKTQDDNAINRYIRKRILEARTNANENQDDLAKKLNKSRVAISDMERGKTAINASTLVQIAHHYKKSITYFYPSDTVIALSKIEEELLEIFKELPIAEQYAGIDYIKQKVKNSKKKTSKP
jgi:transcriptional regulator with XRE-family HTH domain